MKLRKGRGYRRGRIEIIPMIDVMFFLLVTFMLASLSMQSLNSITVNLPQGDAPNLQHKEPVALTITKDSKIFLDKTPTTLDDIQAKLNSVTATSQVERELAALKTELAITPAPVLPPAETGGQASPRTTPEAVPSPTHPESRPEVNT